LKGPSKGGVPRGSTDEKLRGDDGPGRGGDRELVGARMITGG